MNWFYVFIVINIALLWYAFAKAYGLIKQMVEIINFEKSCSSDAITDLKKDMQYMNNKIEKLSVTKKTTTTTVDATIVER